MSLVSEIHHEALALAREFKKVEAELMAVIQQIDRMKVFREYGYTSTFDYVIRALGLSEPNAYALIGVARKAEEIPEIQRALTEGKVTVSKLSKVLSVMTPENHGEWLAKAEKLPCRKLEQEVARAAPLAVGQERIRQLTDDVRELRIPIDQELFEMLERVKDLRKNQSAQAVLKTALGFYLEKNDPLRKKSRTAMPRTLHVKSSRETRAKTPAKAPAINPAINPAKTPAKTSRDSTIPAPVRREVLMRDQGRCTHVSIGGERCRNTRYVEVHHLRPRAQGGTHSVANLRVLCSEHHTQAHEFL